MAKRLLSRDKIVSEAFEMVEKNSLKEFSLRKLAAKLGVQVSSLYNYFSGEEDIMIEISLRAIDMFTDCIDNAREGLTRDEAAFSTADAFRKFVQENSNLYEVIVTSKWTNAPAAEYAAQKFLRPIYVLMSRYGVEDKAAQTHIFRAIRVVTHGFCTLEVAGEFEQGDASASESYHLMVQGVVDLMKKYGTKEEVIL